jgi:predicted nucleotidyltransferase component of viral defense system
MIPENTIIAWGIKHPWTTKEQIEQDLLLSRALCAIYNDDFLANELVFRGGTALHKLLLQNPYRYSEDLDFVRTTAGGISPIIGRIADIGKELGFLVNTKLSKYPKIFWKYTSETGRDLKIKIEMNTFERSPAMPLVQVNHAIKTNWYAGNAEIRTFANEEIAATKVRALFQRSKGRDLFDLWLMLTQLKVEPVLVREIFHLYQPEGYTPLRAVESLERKLNDETFRLDINNLLINRPPEYDIDQAGRLVCEQLLTD